MRTHRRKVSGRNKAIGGVVAAAVVGGGALLFTGTAQAAGVGAAYTRTSDWSTGYTGQYVVTNNTGATEKDWTLEFDLPDGSRLSSLWNAESSVSGRHVTVKAAKWDTEGLAPGASVTVGFVVNGTADPTGCLVDDTRCSADSGPTPEPSGRPTDAPSPTATATRPSTPTDAPTGTPTTAAPTTAAPTKDAGTGTTAGRLRPLRRHLALPGLRPARERRRDRRQGLQPRLRHRRRRLHPEVGRCHRPRQ